MWLDLKLNPVKLNYYPFMTSLDKCNGICNNAFDDFSAIACISSKAKGVNVKVFKMMTRTNGSKTLAKHHWCS